jgi:regulator of protease activity HflC (stomatin/prohibitin superfamily)
MKKFLAVLSIVFMAVFSTACSKVPAGNVGVKVYLLGGEKGVDSEVLGTGRYWIGPNEDLFLYPTYSQTVNYDEAGEKKQRISFQDRDGTQLSVDVGVQFSVSKEQVPVIFQKFRAGNEELADRVLYRVVRDAFVQESSKRSVEDIYGSGKVEFVNQVRKTVMTDAAEMGVTVEEVSLLGPIVLPPNILNALNAKIQANQMAMQRENELRTAEAEAKKEIAKAEGDAKSQLLRAEADAKAITLRANALSANQRLVELTVAEKWDGKLPVNMYGGGAVPFINVDRK